jgi:hypothetical protein
MTMTIITSIDGGRSEGSPPVPVAVPVAVPVPLPIPDSNARRVYTGASKAAGSPPVPVAVPVPVPLPLPIPDSYGQRVYSGYTIAAASFMSFKSLTCGLLCFCSSNRPLISDDELGAPLGDQVSYGSQPGEATALPNQRPIPCEPPRGIHVLLYFVLSCCADLYVVVGTPQFVYGNECSSITRIDADGHIKAPTAFVVYLCLFVLSVAFRFPECVTFCKELFAERPIDPPSNPAYGDSYALNMIKILVALMFLSTQFFSEVPFERDLFCQTKELPTNSTACNKAVCDFIEGSMYGDIMALMAGVSGASMSFLYIGYNLFNLMRSKCNGKVEDPINCLFREGSPSV